MLLLDCFKSDRSYECEECGKAFLWGSQLTRHQRIHTGEEPYVCKECGKSFIWGSQLTRHRKIHTDAEPYKCKESGQIFSHHSYFAEQKIHSGENLYQWKYYGNTISHDSYFAQHQSIYTFEKSYGRKDFERAFSPGSHFISLL